MTWVQRGHSALEYRVWTLHVAHITPTPPLPNPNNYFVLQASHLSEREISFRMFLKSMRPVPTILWRGAHMGGKQTKKTIGLVQRKTFPGERKLTSLLLAAFGWMDRSGCPRDRLILIASKCTVQWRVCVSVYVSCDSSGKGRTSAAVRVCTDWGAKLYTKIFHMRASELEEGWRIIRRLYTNVPLQLWPIRAFSSAPQVYPPCSS